VYSPTHLLQLQSFFIQSSRGEVTLPHCPVECATLQLLLEAFPSPSTRGEVAPLLPSPVGLFIFFPRGEVPLPPLSGAQGALPSLLRVFLIFSASCLLFSLFFSLFSLGGG
jgi:hypothetical protein